MCNILARSRRVKDATRYQIDQQASTYFSILLLFNQAIMIIQLYIIQHNCLAYR